MWPVIGHEWAVDLLARSVEAGQTSHAYLFLGPSQVGKTSLAKAFARMLLCREENRPCGRCRACRLVEADRHPDVLVVAPVKGSIKIEVIRDLQHTVSLSPVEGERRFCVITNADMATTSAANCLLKTLEEPPSRVTIVLTAGRVGALLPTVVSRCQVLSLRPVPTAQIVAALQERGVADEEAQLLGHLAQGRIGWALEAARDEDVFSRRNQVLDDLSGLIDGTTTRRFAWAENMSRQPDEIAYVLTVFSSWWRDVMLLAAGSSAQIVNIDQREKLGQWADRFSVATAQKALRSLGAAGWRLDHNANVRLALEVLTLDMPGRPRNGS